MDFFMAGKVTEVQSVYMFVVGTIEAYSFVGRLCLGTSTGLD